jgi:hypothetical protein
MIVLKNVEKLIFEPAVMRNSCIFLSKSERFFIVYLIGFKKKF